MYRPLKNIDIFKWKVSHINIYISKYIVNCNICEVFQHRKQQYLLWQITKYIFVLNEYSIFTISMLSKIWEKESFLKLLIYFSPANKLSKLQVASIWPWQIRTPVDFAHLFSSPFQLLRQLFLWHFIVRKFNKLLSSGL